MSEHVAGWWVTRVCADIVWGAGFAIGPSFNASDGIGQWGASRAASWRGSLAQLDGRAPRRFCERAPQAAAGYIRCFRVLDTSVVGVRVRDGWMNLECDGVARSAHRPRIRVRAGALWMGTEMEVNQI